MTSSAPPSTPPLQLWLDTDPGFDDWMAWLLIESLPQWRLHGVSVVAGNAPLPVTLRNALRIKALHALAAPVYAGCDRPLAQPLHTAQHVLGEEGMSTAGPPLPPTSAQPEAQHGVLAFIDAVRANPGRITLLALGPLTNIALAFALAPDLPRLLAGVVVMGGSTQGGNATAAAEFNIHADPEAAVRVWADCEAAGQPVVMFGLNVCHHVPVSDSHVGIVRALPGLQAQIFAGYLEGYVGLARQRGRPRQSLYDPTPVMWLAHPECFELRPGRVEIELAGQHSRGMTVCDLRGPAQQRANSRVAMQADGHVLLSWAFGQIARRLALKAPPR